MSALAHDLVALLGALTHQAAAVLMPGRQTAGGAGFVTRFRTVSGPAYATAVCVLWVLAWIMGADGDGVLAVPISGTFTTPVATAANPRTAIASAPRIKAVRREPRPNDGAAGIGCGAGPGAETGCEAGCGRGLA